MRWLALLLPHLTLEVATRSQPGEIEARPAAVLREHRIVDLNAAAHAQGVRPGSSRASARVVCPELLCIEDDIDCRSRVAAMLSRLCGWAYGYSASVSPEPPDALLIEIEGSLRLFGGQSALLHAIEQDLQELGLSVSVGIAHTPMAALLLARAERLLPDCPLPELRTRVLESIDSVSLRCCQCSIAQRTRLEAMGVRTLGALLRLPRPALARRFGPALALYLDRLTGRRDEPRRTVTPTPRFSSTLHFMQDVTNTTGLRFPMRRQLDELAVWLRSRQLTTDTLVWHFRHPAHPPGRCLIRLARPEVNASVFLELTRLRLERPEAGAVPPAVASMTLTARRLVPLDGRSRNVRLSLDRRGHEGMDDDPMALVDRIDARLGDGSCRRLLRLADHRPEYAQRCERVVSATPAARVATSAAAVTSKARPSVRPVWLLQRPLPIAERAGALYWQGPLRLLQGPERIDTAWWAGGQAAAARVSRDYYLAAPDSLAATESPAAPERSSVPAGSGPQRTGMPASPHALMSGASRAAPRYWIFLDLRTGQWYLHGLFG